ncbi:MAG: aspartate/glutamate racemase family protein [Gammaproteobacteria bacterium]
MPSIDQDLPLTLGLLGGMSWESTVPYYQLINRGVAARLGALHSARIVLHSVDFHEIERMQSDGDWDAAGALLADVARGLEAAGARALLICTNTMHKVAVQVSEAVSIPLLHIADCTAQALVSDGVQRVGLLGTRFTMEQDFYKGRLSGEYGLDVIVPPAQDRDIVHAVIYNDLCQGRIPDQGRAEYVRIISEMQAAGAQAVILGCTEIGLLVKQDDVDLPLYDTTALHAQAAVNFAVGD